MAEDRPGVTPADDSHEFRWPEDTKDVRKVRRKFGPPRTTGKPAPLWLTEATLGIATVLAFILPVTLLAGDRVPAFVEIAKLVVVGGLTVGLFVALALKPIVSGWRRGLPQLAAIVAGFVVGFAWTWLFLTYQGSAPAARVAVGIFMGSAVATGYYVALIWAERFRFYPQAVYVLAGIVGLLAVLGI